jgi:hypothetical protein
MIGRKFTDLRNGKIVEVTDLFEDVIILDGSKKIKMNQLLNRNHFDEYIDPKNFFRNDSLLNTFAQKIKEIPDNLVKNIRDENLLTESHTQNETRPRKVKLNDPMQPVSDEPAILPADPEMEKLELMKKYGILNDPFSDAQKQLDKFKSILEDLDPKEEVQTFEVIRENDEEVIEDFQNDEEVLNENVLKNQVKKDPETMRKIESNQRIDDPIIAMFKNVKRNREFNVTIDYQNKIPRADFIEMMEDSYNTSIIEFLANEFTNQILENPEIIKNKIIEEIKKIVYKKEEVKTVESNTLKEINLENKIETKIVEKPKRGRTKKQVEKNDRSAVN